MYKRLLVLLTVALFVLSATLAFAGGRSEAGGESAEQQETVGTASAGTGTSLEVEPLPPWEIYNLSDWEAQTGKTITEFHEAPILADMVAAGTLPPLEERIPVDPLVVKPTEGIGTYGGTLIFAGIHMLEGGEFTHVVDSTAFTTAQNGGDKTLPYAMKGYDQSDDGKVITLYLREGLKWSDGYPVTADDVLFYFNDLVFGPEELRQTEFAVESGFEVDGHQPTVTKVNDYEVRIEYPVPAWNFMYFYNYDIAQSGIRPKHAMMKYHLSYNPDANELARQYGFDTWVQLLAVYQRLPYQAAEELNKERPVLGPWMFDRQLADGMVFVRNPYYFQVDTEGNQLPYIDEVKVVSVENTDLYTAKALSGEVDFANWGLGLNSYPVFAEEAQNGKFRLLLTKGVFQSNTTYWFNLDYDTDPQVGALLANAQFRQALSLAIDRDYVNDTLYFGKGIPTQLTLGRTIPYYEQRWGEAYAEYDPDRANALLDELGLQWDADHKFRQYEDGVTVTVEVVTMTNHAPDYIPTLEIVQQEWEKIGVNVNIKPVTKKYQGQYYKANRAQIHSRGTNYFTDTLSIVERRAREVGPKYMAPRWYQWLETGGTGGVEPPAEYMEWAQKCYSLPDIVDPQELQETIKWIFDWQAENIVAIGVVGYVPTPAVVANGLGNIPTDIYGANTYLGLVPFRPQDWFWKK